MAIIIKWYQRRNISKVKNYNKEMRPTLEVILGNT